MLERSEMFVKGDVITAERLNETVRQANRSARRSHATGLGGFSADDFDVDIGPQRTKLILVRVKTDIIPELFAAASSTNLIESNAVLQQWDDLSTGWVDIDGEEIIVTPKENLPLLENQLVYVTFSISTRRWTPAFQERAAHVRVPAGTVADANGFYAGFIDEWDNDALVWVTKRTCWVRDSNT